MHVENDQPIKMTPEEFEKRKQEIIKHIEIQMPLLLKQVEEQRLITELEELKMRQAYAIYKISSMMAPEPEDPMVAEPMKKETT